MENLLKCVDIWDNIYYFHGWTEIEKVAIHPEDPAKDHKYSAKAAILENIKTGETERLEPGCFKFLREGYKNQTWENGKQNTG